MEDLLKQILEGQAQIIKRLDSIDERLDRLEAGQQKDVIALLERTATKEAVLELDTKIDLLNDRLFKQETKLSVLARAK